MTAFARCLLVLSMVAAAAGSASAQPGADRDQARTLVQKTLRRFLQDFDLGAARLGFIAAIAADRNHAPAYFNLALVAHAQGGFDEAIKLFDEVRRKTKDKGLAQRAIVHRTEATTAKRRAAQPEDRRRAEYADLTAQGQWFLQAGMLQEAVTQAGRAVALDPTRWEAYALAATAARASRDYDSATLFFAKAVERAPTSLKQDLQSIQAGLGQEAADASAVSQAMRAYYSGRFEESTGLLRRLSERSSNPQHAILLALSMHAGGDHAGAIELIRQLAASHDPSSRQQAQRVLDRLAESSARVR